MIDDWWWQTNYSLDGHIEFGYCWYEYTKALNCEDDTQYSMAIPYINMGAFGTIDTFSTEWCAISLICTAKIATNEDVDQIQNSF